MPQFRLLLLASTLIFSLGAASAQMVEKWLQRYDGGHLFGDTPTAVVVDGMGNVIVTGESYIGSSNDIYTLKYAPDGTLLWAKRFNGPDGKGEENPVLAVDASGNVIVSATLGTVAQERNYVTLKYAAADGALLWQHVYNGPGNSSDVPSAVVVDASGDVIVTGYSINASGNKDYCTIKLDAIAGTELWVRRYDSLLATSNSDEAKALALDGAGNAIVTGVSRGSGTNGDFYTIKYSAVDGSTLWARRFATSLDDQANAVAVDGVGDVFVTGQSDDTAGTPDYYTVKYRGDDGTPIWSRRYNGPGNNGDYPAALAVDAAGSVVVTGRSYLASGASTNMVTLKYSGLDGTTLWEQTHDGPAADDDAGVAVRVDALGRVIVAGYQTNFGTADNTEFYTVQYAGADGAVLWEGIYGESGTGVDTPSACALTADGGVVVTGRSKGVATIDYATIRYGPATGLDLWRQTWFGSTRNNGNGANSADPERDGLPNVLEYAFGLSPVQNSAGGVPSAVNDSGYLTMTIPKQPDVTYEVQSGGTLIPAQPGSFSAASTTVITNNATTLKVRDNVLLGTTPNRFMRVKVTSAP